MDIICIMVHGYNGLIWHMINIPNNMNYQKCIVTDPTGFSRHFPADLIILNKGKDSNLMLYW